METNFSHYFDFWLTLLETSKELYSCNAISRDLSSLNLRNVVEVYNVGNYYYDTCFKFGRIAFSISQFPIIETYFGKLLVIEFCLVCSLPLSPFLHAFRLMTDLIYKADNMSNQHYEAQLKFIFARGIFAVASAHICYVVQRK